jgi:hypothetical protein
MALYGAERDESLRKATAELALPTGLAHATS